MGGDLFSPYLVTCRINYFTELLYGLFDEDEGGVATRIAGVHTDYNLALLL